MRMSCRSVKETRVDNSVLREWHSDEHTFVDGAGCPDVHETEVRTDDVFDVEKVSLDIQIADVDHGIPGADGNFSALTGEIR